jgi:hypothetical protein
MLILYLHCNLVIKVSISFFFFSDFCHARKCYLRSVFIDICRIVIELYSKKFFKESFYEYLLELHTDSVPNIRLRLCSILPDLKRLLILPTDRGLLQQLDACVRKLLVSEKDRDVTEGIHEAVEELDKIHIPMQSVRLLQHWQNFIKLIIWCRILCSFSILLFYFRNLDWSDGLKYCAKNWNIDVV